MLAPAQLQQFRDQGYLVVENVLSQADVAMLINTLERMERTGDRETVGVNWSEDTITTIQNIPLQPAPLSRIVRYRPVVALVEQLVGRAIRVTGGLLLDKDPKHNWDIGWHQDSGIYVDHIPDGEGQDVRGGLPVLTTRGLELARNVTCRIALDPSGPENGGLYVLPGSHRTNLGIGKHVYEPFAHEKGVCVRQAPGSMLCYAPLLLHRSEKSTRPDGRRRVLHLQYGSADLELPGTTCYPFPQPVPLTAVESLVG